MALDIPSPIDSTNLSLDSSGLNVSGEIASSDWTNYSPTSTVVGWSSTTTKIIYTKKIGKVVFCQFTVDGTSNSTITTFTMPYTCNAQIGGRFYIVGLDNGTWMPNGGNGEVLANSTTITFYPGGVPGTVWTASGAKRIYGSFFYESA